MSDGGRNSYAELQMIGFVLSFVLFGGLAVR